MSRKKIAIQWPKIQNFDFEFWIGKILGLDSRFLDFGGSTGCTPSQFSGVLKASLGTLLWLHIFLPHLTGEKLDILLCNLFLVCCKLTWIVFRSATGWAGSLSGVLQLELDYFWWRHMLSWIASRGAQAELDHIQAWWRLPHLRGKKLLVGKGSLARRLQAPLALAI